MPPPTMDLVIQHLIFNAVISTVATAIAAIQVKYEEEMFALREMIEKSLVLRQSAFSTVSPDPNALSKAPPRANLLLKTIERWNQADYRYFDLNLNKTYSKSEIVLDGKNVYYKNVVFFVQRLQSLVTFKGAGLVKANIVVFLCDLAFK